MFSKAGFDLADEVSHLTLVDEPDDPNDDVITVTGFASMMNGKVLEFQATHSTQVGSGGHHEERLRYIGYLNVNLP